MELKSLRVAAAQYPITQHKSWPDWEAHTLKWITDAVENQAKLLVFPEYGAMELVSLLNKDLQNNLTAQVTEISNFHEDFLRFFSIQARVWQVGILAPSLPVLIPSRKKTINRAYYFSSKGEIHYQNKEHMTRFEDEEWGISTGGIDYKVIEDLDVKIGINICFDVEFPFAAHNLAKKGVQILLAPSCTDSMKGLQRVHIGARARALENQFYVVVAQTVGEASWSYAVDTNVGQAAIYSTCDINLPDDGTLAMGALNKPQWLYCDLDLSLIEKARTNGQVFNYKQMCNHL